MPFINLPVREEHYDLVVEFIGRLNQATKQGKVPGFASARNAVSKVVRKANQSSSDESISRTPVRKPKKKKPVRKPVAGPREGAQDSDRQVVNQPVKQDQQPQSVVNESVSNTDARTSINVVQNILVAGSSSEGEGGSRREFALPSGLEKFMPTPEDSSRAEESESSNVVDEPLPIEPQPEEEEEVPIVGYDYPRKLYFLKICGAVHTAESSSQMSAMCRSFGLTQGLAIKETLAYVKKEAKVTKRAFSVELA